MTQALSAPGVVLAHSQLNSLVDSTAHHLKELGTQAGDRVLITLPSSPSAIVAALAVMRCDGFGVPVGDDCGPARIEHIARSTRARVCLHAPDTNPVHGLPGLALDINSADTAPDAVSPTGMGGLILFSSGSTGFPKGVVLPEAQLAWTAKTLAEHYGFEKGHRELMVVTVNHSDGWQRAAATLAVGGCVVFPETPLTVSGLLEDIRTQSIHGFFLPPPMVRLLLKAPSANLAGCRSLEIGSAPLSAKELDAFIALAPNAKIFVHYGLTECSRAIVLDAVSNPEKRHTVGVPLPGVELSLREDSIFLRGPQLAEGYWDDPEQTNARFVDGWLDTGDEGRLDEDGFLIFSGRKDDMITCGGHHFFPAEAETELGPVPGSAQYLFAGVPDTDGVLGEVPWAFVVPDDKNDWSPSDFMTAARTRLPAQMVPRNIVVLDKIPLTPSGKPDRRRCAQENGPK